MQTTTGELTMTILKKRIRDAGVLAALLSASAFAATNFVRTDLVADTAGGGVGKHPPTFGALGGISIAARALFVFHKAERARPLLPLASIPPTPPTTT